MDVNKVFEIAIQLKALTPKELAILVALIANDRDGESTMQIMEYCFNTPKCNNKYL